MSLMLESYYSKIIMGQKNSIPWINRLILKVAMEKGIEDYYANYRSVVEYPRYLFRQDIKQKWTNERTPDNICILPQMATLEVDIRSKKLEEIYEFKAYDFTYTADLLEALLSYQYSFFISNLKRSSLKMKNIGIECKRNIAQRIRFFDMVANNTKVEEIVEVFMDLQKSNKNLTPLCAVYHQDEDYKHVHFLYILDPYLTLSKKELKQIPHIENIIKEKYGE